MSRLLSQYQSKTKREVIITLSVAHSRVAHSTWLYFEYKLAKPLTMNRVDFPFNVKI